MSIVLEDSNLNVAEQVNVLFKSSLGFPSTKESTPWFQETSVKYNNYVNGEEILLDEIPSNPSFSVTPNLVDVNVSSSQLATGGYIKEDSTGVIRQYHRLILTPVPNSSNNSYYALDTEGNNILTDGLQFNTKWSGSGNKIYPYTLYTEAFISADSSAPNELGQDSTGGNWLYDLKNGVIFFPDYSSSLCNGTTNKPVFSFYKYIGRKGMVKQIDFKNSLLDIPNTTKKYDKQIVVQTSDNTIHRYDSATSSWVSIGGSGGGETYDLTVSNDLTVSGKVGIGTTSPGAKLEVNGNVEIRRTAGETSSLTVSSVGTALNNMKNSIIYMGTRYSTSETGYEGKKIALIAESLNNNEWADVNKAKLHFCVNNDSSNGGTSADLDDSRMTIQPNGKVGIGSTSPGAALDIAAGTSGQGGFTDNAQYLRLADIHGTNWDPGGSGGWGGGPTRDSYGGWSLHCHHEAAFAAHIFVYSDRRIKTNIVDVSDNQALEMVRNIPCRYYEYKDKLTRGYDKTIGFIAQEVREVMPMAVKTLTTIIPNEMRNLTDISWNNTTLYSDLSDCSGVKYRFYVSNDISGNETMKEVVGNNDDSFTFDTSYNYVYCYGKEVDDFHTLDKAKLFALNFSATQEIDRIQQQQLLDISGNKIDIELLKLENEELKLENSTLTTKVNILETELNNLKSVVQGLIEAQMSS